MSFRVRTTSHVIPWLYVVDLLPFYSSTPFIRQTTKWNQRTGIRTRIWIRDEDDRRNVPCRSWVHALMSRNISLHTCTTTAISQWRVAIDQKLTSFACWSLVSRLKAIKVRRLAGCYYSGIAFTTVTPTRNVKLILFFILFFILLLLYCMDIYILHVCILFPRLPYFPIQLYFRSDFVLCFFTDDIPFLVRPARRMDIVAHSRAVHVLNRQNPS